jgi:hypothetical protein
VEVQRDPVVGPTTRKAESRGPWQAKDLAKKRRRSLLVLAPDAVDSGPVRG